MIRTKAALPDKAVQAHFREVDCVMNESQTQAKLVSPCISVCQMDAEKGCALAVIGRAGKLPPGQVCQQMTKVFC